MYINGCGTGELAGQKAKRSLWGDCSMELVIAYEKLHRSCTLHYQRNLEVPDNTVPLSYLLVNKASNSNIAIKFFPKTECKTTPLM